MMSGALSIDLSIDLSIGLTADDAVSVHRVHLLLLLGGWTICMGGWAVYRRLWPDGGAVGPRVRHALPGLAVPRLAVATLATSLSAVIHLAVSPEHFRESTDYGVFFVVLATLQLAGSLALLRRPSAPLLRLGGLLSAAVIVLWVETRAVGIGLGPIEAGREALGLPDLVSTAAELCLVLVALRGIRSVPPPDRVPVPRPVS